MSTDCCTYTCTQGRNCPVRASKYSCDELGVCNAPASPLVTQEGGATVTGCHAEPTEQQDLPLTTWEAIFLYGTITVCGISTLIVDLGSLGYLYFKWWA